MSTKPKLPKFVLQQHLYIGRQLRSQYNNMNKKYQSPQYKPILGGWGRLAAGKLGVNLEQGRSR